MDFRIIIIYSILVSPFHKPVNCLIDYVHVTINLTDQLTNVGKDYLSIAVGPNLIHENVKNFFRSRKAIALTKGLSPARFRFGGTQSDFLIFNNSKLSTSSSIHHDNFTMNVTDLDDLNFFTNETGLRLLFCLNMLLRNATSWNPKNSLKLLNYSFKTNYSDLYDLELGNEPNHIQHHWSKAIAPEQLAKDFSLLQFQINSSNELKEAYKKALFVGPDVTRPKVKEFSPQYFNLTCQEFLWRYLKTIKANKIRLDAITWHQYYVNGRETSIHDFVSPMVLNLFPQQAKIIQNIAHKTGFQHTPIWLGETGSAYGGGAAGLSDSYVAGFLWLDKLGVASKYGIKVIIRQTLHGGHYALLDENLNPNTDYWLSYIFKILVGDKVLSLSLNRYHETLRTYAHCTSKTDFPKGSVTIFAMNLREETVHLYFSRELNVDYCASYLLTPSEPNNLTSKFISLNGRKLIIKSNGTLPSIKPSIFPRDSPFVLPGKTYGFFVLAGQVTQICS